MRGETRGAAVRNGAGGGARRNRGGNGTVDANLLWETLRNGLAVSATDESSKKKVEAIIM
jgi:hypothetical protein